MSRLLARFWPVFSALSLIALAPPALAATPSTMQVEGTLKVAGGVAVDGVYTLGFALYGAEKGGSASWSELGVKVTVSGGHFRYILGSANPIPAAALKSGNAWLGVAVGADPELPRQRLHAVAFARHSALADGLSCSGCVDGAALGAGSVGTKHVGFTYSGSATKGGPANKALDLDCTGCVSVKELTFDGDVDLSGKALKAGKITADSVVAKQVSAAAFIGDGSKLTGLKLPVGACKQGESVTGINADGSLACAKTLSGDSFPNDVLDVVSNGQLTTKFIDTIVGAQTPVPIKDNNPVGTDDSIDFPDVGIVRDLTVRVKLTNSDLSGVEIALFDPANAKHVLLSKGKGKGTALDLTWPEPAKQESGDLASWIGKNAKGKWRLLVTDLKHKDNKTDGNIETWHVRVHTLSSKQVEAKGTLLASGGLVLQKLAKAPFSCGPAHVGYMYYETTTQTLRVCNGEEWGAVGVGTLGTEDNPAGDCKEIKTKYPNKPSGTYWLERGGLKFKAYCDQSTAGGGWTLLLTLTHPRDQYPGSVHPLATAKNPNAPDPKTAYSRDWRGVFVPKKDTELLMKRGTTGQWVRFVVNSFCGFDSTSAGVCTGCHGTYASGCVFGSDGKQIGCNSTWLNSCSNCGGCQNNGCDTLGFNVNHNDYAALYNNSMRLWGSGWHGSQCYGAWDQAGQQTNVFPQTTWIR